MWGTLEGMQLEFSEISERKNAKGDNSHPSVPGICSLFEQIKSHLEH